jgi:FkbM family methyltransferase
MLLNLHDLVRDFNLQITGVLHVGAHLGEAADYHALGIEKVIWIEANPNVLSKLRANVEPYGYQVVHALIMDAEHNGVPFNVTNYDGMSSSIFEWGTHTQLSPDTIVEHKIYLDSTTLDKLDLDYSGINFLNMDLEGAELLALKGATNLLKQIEYLYLEVRTDYVYLRAPLIDELEAYIPQFERLTIGMAEYLTTNDAGWGDAFYVRRH